MEWKICDIVTRVSYKLMSIGITGGQGFIGSHVVHELLSKNYEIVLYCRKGSKKKFDNKNIKYVFLDFEKPEKKLLHKIKLPKIFIYLAWSGVQNYNSLHHFETELDLHYRFIKYLIINGVEKVIVSGTCFEYGLKSGSLKENCIPVPENSYGVSKNFLRQQLFILKKFIPFNLIWLRLFYVYGEGQHNNSLYTSLKNAEKNNETHFDMSGGEQIRDFIKVSTVSELIVKIIFSKIENEIINICSSNPISVKNFVKDLIRCNDWKIKPKLGVFPYSPLEPMEFWGNNQKLKRLLD